MASYIYTDEGHVLTITVNGVMKTYTFPLNTLVTIPRAPIHSFSVEELYNMGVPDKITIDERNNRISAELSGGIHTSYCFYYIKAQPYDGEATCIWIESDAEAEKLRADIHASLAEYVRQREHDTTCTCCGEKEVDCVADHGDEMRQIGLMHMRY